MSREHLLYILAILVYLTALLHLAAIRWHFYWTLWWYDFAPHLLGGAFISLLVLWFVFFSRYVRMKMAPDDPAVLWFALVSVFVVSVGWESFEWVLGNAWGLEGYFLDTALDLLLALLGGLAGGLFFAKRYGGKGAVETPPHAASQ